MPGRRCFAAAAILAGAVAVMADSPSGLSHYAPDAAVNIYNETDDTLFITVDGASACAIPRIGECTVMLEGGNAETQHGIGFDEGDRTSSDTVSVADCHWNWNGMKTFTVDDDRIHFECQDNVTTAQLVALCEDGANACRSIAREGIERALEDPGMWKDCFASHPELSAPERLGPLSRKIAAELARHPEIASSEAQTAITVILYRVLDCSL